MMAKKKQTKQRPLADGTQPTELPLGVKLFGAVASQATVCSLAFDPTGEVLASGDTKGVVNLCDALTGRLLHSLKLHETAINCVVFDRLGEKLVSAGLDGTVKFSLTRTGKLARTLEDLKTAVIGLAFDAQGQTMAGGCDDATVRLWRARRGKRLPMLKGHRHGVTCVAFNTKDSTLASGSFDRTVKLWDSLSGNLLHTLEGHQGAVWSVAFTPAGVTLATGSQDTTVRLWDASSGKLHRTLEGHTDSIHIVAFSPDGNLLASKSIDGTIRLWDCETWETVMLIPEPTYTRWWTPALAFHPTLPLLATAGAESRASDGEQTPLIHIWELDYDVLLGRDRQTDSVCYKNAKAVLVGDTGVGKSGLSLVLNHEPFEATESTPGRRVWKFNSVEVALKHNLKQTRETLLWDLAGQPGYRVIHQLHLNEVAIALVVFDARSETDPLAGVRHWERALRLAQQRQGASAVPMKKFLVSARNDRGGVSIGEERLQAILKEFKFDGYFRTSAKEGWEIKELRAAIENAIQWDDLPEVLSSQLFADIKTFLLEVKKSGRLLVPASQLFSDFARERPGTAASVANLRDQFETCIGRLENRDLIRRLTFGGYVLLQPELLDAYGSAMVNTAKEEPDGLGSLAEEIALAGKFFVPKEQKITDLGQEQLLLHATVEELVRHDLALRENADDGRYLVFPSQFNRDYEDAPEPKGKAVAITFDGPVQSLYSTLAVRLGHSGLFTTGRAEMWRNAAVFNARAGGKCGLFLNEFAEGRGRLILFFPDERSSPETRFHFEEFVLAHAERRALDGTVELVRFFVCPKCSTPVPDAYVIMLKEQGQNVFNCFCAGKGVVSLAEPKERLQFPSAVEAMDRSADRQRDFDAFVMSAKGETSTKSFLEWAGGAQVTLAVVFTDVVGSTALGEEIRDEAMNEVRRAHFVQSRKLIDQFQGREIKTIGDSFMVAFRSADAALDYARALKANTGSSQVQIRAGIHIGPMHVDEDDVFGGTVNFAARVVGAIKGDEIWLSDRAKDDIDRLGAAKYRGLKWERRESAAMKGFSGTFTLWDVSE